jgi:hypothetical protein
VEYIDKCLEHLSILFHYEKHTEEEHEYARVFLQQAHREVFKILDGVATGKECDIIKKSLMAGRIYYHAVKYGAVNDEQIKVDYRDRLCAYVDQIYTQKEFRQNSNEPVLKELVENGAVISAEDRIDKLSKIKTVCREDIVRIEILRDMLKTRQVFYVTT